MTLSNLLISISNTCHESIMLKQVSMFRLFESQSWMSHVIRELGALYVLPTLIVRLSCLLMASESQGEKITQTGTRHTRIYNPTVASFRQHSIIYYLCNIYAI